MSQMVSSIHHGSSRPSIDLLDAVPEPAQHVDRLGHARRDARLDDAEAEIGAERDPERLERRGQRAEVRRRTAGRATCGRARPRPAMTSSISAQSATVRVIGPMCDTVSTALAGYCAISPYVGFRPTAPQKLAGMRTEPAPSEPWCSGP